MTPTHPIQLARALVQLIGVTSLLAVNQLLETVEPGLLASDLDPIRKRMERILESRAMGIGELSQRTRILRAMARGTG